MSGIPEFLTRLAGAVVARNAGDLVAAAEFPHTIMVNGGSHVFATAEDLKTFLDRVFAKTEPLLRYEPKVVDTRPFGEDLFIVEYYLEKETASHGSFDRRRHFCIIRQSGGDFQCVACFIAIDTANSQAAPQRDFAA